MNIGGTSVRILSSSKDTFQDDGMVWFLETKAKAFKENLGISSSFYVSDPEGYGGESENIIRWALCSKSKLWMFSLNFDEIR